MIELYQMMGIGFILSATFIGVVWKSVSDRISYLDDKLQLLKKKTVDLACRIETLDDEQKRAQEEVKVLAKVVYKSTTQSTHSEENPEGSSKDKFNKKKHKN